MGPDGYNVPRKPTEPSRFDIDTDKYRWRIKVRAWVMSHKHPTHDGGVFAVFLRRPRIGGTEGLQPANATWHGPVAGGRATSAGTRA